MNLKLKVKLHNVNTISYNPRRKKLDIFWKQNNWAFTPITDLGWILSNSMQIVLNI